MSCNNLPDLKGKGLFVFSDPGGAKTILSFVRLIKLQDKMVISDRKYDFFDDFGIDVIPYVAGDESKLNKSFNPDFIFTGTSHTSDVELKFLKIALKEKIPSYAFIDHYTKFKERFFYKGSYIFPDRICVIDDKAKKIATDNELPLNKIIITGNPYLKFLENWKPSLTKSSFFNLANIPGGNNLCLYAPDPLSNVGGKLKYGTDEVELLKDLIEIFSDKEMRIRNVTFAIKLHPNQKEELILPLINKVEGINIIFANQVHTNTLLFYSNVVIGMFSNILIEADALGTKVIRYLGDRSWKDPLEFNNVGIRVYSLKQLKHILIKHI